MASPSKLLAVLRHESKLWVPLAALVFLLASVLLSGWPDGLIPNLQYPLTYSLDGMFTSTLIQRLVEGPWYFHSARCGFPFHDPLLDYPASDAGQFIVLKALASGLNSYCAALNLYIFLGFSITFATAYGTLRCLTLRRPLSVAGAVLFAFLPFHFLRLTHILYTWYFVVPVYFYYSFKIFTYVRSAKGIGVLLKQSIPHIFAFLLLASFGIYNAVFGILLLLASGALAFASSRSFARLVLAVGAALVTIAGVSLNVAPNLYYKVLHGNNPEVAHRLPAESEIYGLKLSQLLLPTPNHRFPPAAEIVNLYNNSFPLINENRSSALGLVGAIGLLILLGVAFVSIIGLRLDFRLTVLAALTLIMLLFTTIGGLASLVALLISPSIRGWNRISVFVGFASLTAAFVCLEHVVGRVSTRLVSVTRLGFAVAIVVGVVGLWDQTTAVCKSCSDNLKRSFECERDFVQSIEASLPAKAAVYQLPYMSFPEARPLHGLYGYELAAGFLHSKTLLWNYGGMKGRAGDLFYRALATQPMKRQIEIIGKLGFSGIYVDRRGFGDGGKAIEADVQEVLGRMPSVVSGDGQMAFYRVTLSAPPDSGHQPAAEIMRRAGFVADADGARYTATLEQGIDFAKSVWPSFVGRIGGVSRAESWGRWSDATADSAVRVEFVEPLPKSFTVVIRAYAFGPNVGRPVKVKVGGGTQSIEFSSAMEDRRLCWSTDGHQRILEIVPPAVISPAALGLSSDGRKLGLGIERIRFETSCNAAEVDVGFERSMSKLEDASIEQGIDFAKSVWPSFVGKIRGVSHAEPWGRWSDATIYSAVRIEFIKPLPKSFTVVIRAYAFGPNVGRAVRVKVGGSTQTMSFSSTMQDRRLHWSTDGRQQVLEIAPPAAISPAALGLNTDARRLGLAIERIWFEASGNTNK